MAQNDTLTQKQRRAIACLLSTRTIEDAAAQAKTSRRTLFRWLAEPAFRAALVEAEGDAIDQATRRLIGLQDTAIDTFDAILCEALTPKNAGAHLRAAQAILDYLLRLRELRNVEERLGELEKAVFYGNKPK